MSRTSHPSKTKQKKIGQNYDANTTGDHDRQFRNRPAVNMPTTENQKNIRR